MAKIKSPSSRGPAALEPVQKKRSIQRVSVICLVLVIAFFIAGEVGVRVIGLVSFPLYELGSGFNYVQRPSQSGSFLNKNDWVVNALNMPTAEPYTPSTHPSLVLIGNSIVFGGNPYTQRDKVPAILQDELKGKIQVWPVAAGGWTQENEIGFLKQHLQVVENADYVAWEYMSGGLSGPATWAGEYISPTRRPLLASWYVFWRYIYPRMSVRDDDPVGAVELPPSGEPTTENVQAFRTFLASLAMSGDGHRKPVVIWLYPKRQEFRAATAGAEWLPERSVLEKIARDSGVELLDIAKVPTWSEAYYKPDGTHLTVEGNRALATILKEALLR